MIIQKYEKNGLIGKLYHNKMGYYYKIFYGKKVVAMAYVHVYDKNLCISRLLADLDNIDMERVSKLDGQVLR